MNGWKNTTQKKYRLTNALSEEIKIRKIRKNYH